MTPSPAAEPAAAEQPRAGMREWIGLAVLALPCLIYAMDMTVLYLAAPQITAQLKPSASELLWIVDIYAFMVAGFLIVMGTLGDRIGRRRLLMIGAAAFGLSSAIAAFATSPLMLIAARAVQGIAGATLAPSTLALITSMFRNDRERTFAIGVWVASFSSGATLGPMFGGLLLEHFWWGSVLLVNAPLMAILLVLAPLFLSESRASEAGRIDLASAVQSLSAVLLVMFGLKRIAEQGASGLAFAAIILGICIGWLFIRRQRRLADPLIDFAILRLPGVGAALTVNVLGLFTVLGTFFFIAQYLQMVRGMGPLEAGLWTAPSGLIFAIGSVLTPYLLQKYRAETVIIVGLLLAAIGYAMLATIDAHDSALRAFIAMLVFCAGLAPLGTTTTDFVMARAPPDRAGATSAISETSFEFGAAAGIAMFGSLLTAVFTTDMLRAVATLSLDDAARESATHTLGGALDVAKALPSADAQALAAAARDAFVKGMSATAILAAVTSLGAAIVAHFAFGSKSSR